MADQYDVFDDSAVVLPFPTQTPTALYYAVTFFFTHTDGDNDYGAMADRTVELDRSMPGFLGIRPVRDESTGDQGWPGITTSYWSLLKAIRERKNQSDHLAIQKLGHEQWYASYHLRTAKIEYSYGFERQRIAATNRKPADRRAFLRSET